MPRAGGRHLYGFHILVLVAESGRKSNQISMLLAGPRLLQGDSRLPLGFTTYPKEKCSISMDYGPWAEEDALSSWLAMQVVAFLNKYVYIYTIILPKPVALLEPTCVLLYVCKHIPHFPLQKGKVLWPYKRHAHFHNGYIFLHTPPLVIIHWQWHLFIQLSPRIIGSIILVQVFSHA